MFVRVFTRRFGLFLSLSTMLFGTSVLAETQAVELEEIPHATARLIVEGDLGDVSYGPAELEALGARRMTTTTPWRRAPATFEGVLLTDVLEANGLSDVDAIRVVAENDYAVVIEAEVWRNWPLLLATRVNGAAHSRRERGPIQFVFPMSDNPILGSGAFVSNWVWMAARIERVN